MSENKVDLKSTSQYYLYPMANSVNGGEDHSEYNVVKSLGNIVFYSAATRETDFIETGVTYIPGSVNDYRPRFSITTNGGMANCNGYFVKCQPIEDLDLYLTVEKDGIYYISDFKRYLDEYKSIEGDTISGTLTLTYDLYLSINYGDTLATGMSFKMLVGKSSLSSSSSNYNLPEDFKYDLQELYETSYAPLGFSDIGLYLGSIDLQAEIENGAFKDTTTSNVLLTDSTNFLLSDHLMRSIDINRLGSSQYNFYKTLATQLEELYKLNIYGGNLYISYRNSDEDDRQDQIADFGNDYRLQMSFNPVLDSDSTFAGYEGGLSLVRLDGDIINPSKTILNNILKFNASIDETTKSINDMTIALGNDSNELTISGLKTLSVSDDILASTIKINDISTNTENYILLNDDLYSKPDDGDPNVVIRGGKVYNAVWN